jgi:hypothetical protein
MMSPFAPSFLTVYRCTSVMIKGAKHLLDRCEKVAIRTWPLLWHAFSKAFVVGTVVTRSPMGQLASGPLYDLSMSIGIFERVGAHSERGRLAMVVLRKLNEKVLRSYSLFTSVALNASLHNPMHNPAELFKLILSQKKAKGDGHGAADGEDGEDSEDDELAIFGGQKRVFGTTKKRKTANKSTSAVVSPINTPSPGKTGAGEERRASASPVAGSPSASRSGSVLASPGPISTSSSCGVNPCLSVK